MLIGYQPVAIRQDALIKATLKAPLPPQGLSCERETQFRNKSIKKVLRYMGIITVNMIKTIYIH